MILLFKEMQDKTNSGTCGFQSPPHLIGAHGAGFVTVKLSEYGLKQ